MILGLGNPGSEYKGTRHNVGFEVVELLSARHGISLSRVRHRARFGTGRIDSHAVLLAEPLTYMNLSGESARPLLDYHGIALDELIVVHDEADLPVGALRVKAGGGVAGHKGLTSLKQHLGSAEFLRVRIGVGRPAHPGQELADYVLRRPGGAERGELERGVEDAADAIEILLDRGLEAAMREFNRKERGEAPS